MSSVSAPPSRLVPPSGAEQAKLERRASAVARVRHPNLVRMTALPGGAGWSPAVGNTRRLADFTSPGGTFKRFDLEQIVRLLLDVLSGVSALHEITVGGESFVHGDVSPRHIYVDEHGTARLVPLTSGHFRANAKPEEASYAAPERLSGGVWDARADVYSVGVMLWEALAGKRLVIERVDGTLERRQAAVVLGGKLAWARPLSSIAAKAIDPVPAKRYASALELSHAVEMASAQQLARIDTDAWPDEAPTPVFQPRLHLPFPRTTTPEPSVLNLLAPPPAAPALEEPARERETLPPSSPGMRRRAPWAVAGVVATVLVVAPAISLFMSSRLHGGSPPNRAPAAAAELRAPEPVAAPVTPPAPVTPEPAATAPAAMDSVAPGPAATAATSASPEVSAVAPRSTPPRVAPKARPVAKPAWRPAASKRVRADDYGI